MTKCCFAQIASVLFLVTLIAGLTPTAAFSAVAKGGREEGLTLAGAGSFSKSGGEELSSEKTKPDKTSNAIAGEKAWLGIQVQSLPATNKIRTRGVIYELGTLDKGVIVSEVIIGSPAEQMGIKKNDVILSFNDKPINIPSEYTEAFSALAPGDKVVLLIFRDQTQLTVEGAIGRSPVPVETERPPNINPLSTSISAKVFSHTGQHAIRSVAFSPDGKHIISAGESGKWKWESGIYLNLWDTTNGREIRSFIGETYSIDSVTFSPDGRYVLSVSRDNAIKIWDVTTGKEIRTFAGNTDVISSAAFSPDGRYVLSAGEKDNNLKLWDIDSGREIATLRGHTDRVSSLTFSPDSRYALSNGASIIKLWDIAKGSEIRTFDWQKLWFHSQAFSPDGKYALSGSRHTIKLWDIATGGELKTFPDGKGVMSSIAFSPDGDQVLSGRSDGAILLWDVAAGKEIRTVTGHTGRVKSVVFSNDAKSFISGGSDGTIRRWDIKTGKEIAQFISLKDNEWIVLTPEGYYNSSLNGHKYINIRVENKVYGIDQFYDVFYRPDIVTAKLKGEDISSLITLTLDEAIKNPPPSVKLSALPNQTSDPKVKVCYQVQSTGGGIGEVRLFQNGKLIKSDGFYREVATHGVTAPLKLTALNSRAVYQDMRALVVKEKKSPGAVLVRSKGDLVDECVELETIAGENEISLTAFNAPNTVQSVMGTASFISTRKQEEPRLYVLAVGIDRYHDSTINLKYAAKDAQDFIKQLADKAGTIYKQSNIHLTSLVNEQASKSSILATIEKLASQVKHGDSFIFFNASHGLLLQSQYYIVTSSFDGRLNSSASLISSNEIVEVSKKIKSLSQLFIFDTCHAGGVDTIVSGLYDARMSVLAKKMGLHIYASAGSVQAALDGYEGNGLYTHTLLKGLQNGAAVDKDKSGTVTVKSLGSYSKDMTTELSSTLGHPQTPVIINFGKDSKLFEVR